jgi:hypothetical protein
VQRIVALAMAIACELTRCGNIGRSADNGFKDGTEEGQSMKLAFNRLFRSSLLLLLVALMLSFPINTGFLARAGTSGQTSTRNIILGAVALTAGIILYDDYAHSASTASSQVGYTTDGGLVYADGRIVYGSMGITVYVSNDDGGHICAFYGPGARCRSTHLYAYFPRGYVPPCWPPGHCKQYWKHHNENGEHGGNGNRRRSFSSTLAITS